LVIGLGYVGLSLCKRLVEESNLQVQGYDINPATIKKISEEAIYKEIDLNWAKSPDFAATSDIRECSMADVYVISVQTNLGDDGLPDLDPLKIAGQTLSTLVSEGCPWNDRQLH